MADRNGYNPSIIHDGDCYYCGRNETVRHEIFQGKNRTVSKFYGCWLTLCPACHMMVHNDSEISTGLKKVAQTKAMSRYGWSKKDFINVFGKNYI